MKASLPIRAYNVWHDRAVFHFLTQAEQRRDYVSTVTSAVEAAGHDIVSTFGPEGPTRCSGLDVMRYDPTPFTLSSVRAFGLSRA